MGNNILAMLLLLALANRTLCAQSIYQLSPLVPPPAFTAQYYTLQFRVIGMDYPIFRIDGLPPTLYSTLDGRVEGIHNQIGAFPLTIFYYANSLTRTAQTVLAVTEGQRPPLNPQVQSRLTQLQIANSTAITE